MKPYVRLAAAAAVVLGAAPLAGLPALANCGNMGSTAPSSGGQQGGSGDRGGGYDPGAAEGYRQGAQSAAGADLEGDSGGGRRSSGGGGGETSHDYTSQIGALSQMQGAGGEPGAQSAGDGTAGAPFSGGSAALAAQSQLSAAGYYSGPMDGDLGRDTTAAIKTYQRDNGLPITGELDDVTRARLGAQTAAPAADGAAGPAPDPATLDAQSQLAKAGYYSGPTDGKGGDPTTAAIKQFQHDNGLPITGELDDVTRARLGKSN